MADFFPPHQRNILPDGDAVLSVLRNQVTLFSQKPDAHIVQRIQFRRRYTESVNFLSRHHGQGTGHLTDFRREVLKTLAAIDADAHDGVVHESFCIQPQLCEDTAQLSPAVYNIIRPLDSGPESNTFLNGIAHGNTCRAGQMHQLSRGAFRAQKNAQVKPYAGWGEKTPATTPVSAGLVIGQGCGAVGGALSGAVF